MKTLNQCRCAAHRHRQRVVPDAEAARRTGLRGGRGPRTLFNKLVRHSGQVTVTDNEIVVTLRTRANTPYLIQAGLKEDHEPIPWLNNKVLRIQFK